MGKSTSRHLFVVRRIECSKTNTKANDVLTARLGVEVVYGSGVPSTPALSPFESTTKYEKSGKGLIPFRFYHLG